MANSIVRAGKREDIEIVALVTPDVSLESRRKMEGIGMQLLPVNAMSSDLVMSYYRDCFTRLQVFNLIEFDRIVVLDADGVVRQSLDSLFDYPPYPFYACRAYWWPTNDYFTSILYIVEPSETLYKMQFDVWQQAEAENRSMGDMDMSNIALGHYVAMLPGGLVALNVDFKRTPEEKAPVHPLWTVDDWAKNVAYAHWTEAPQGGCGYIALQRLMWFKLTDWDQMANRGEANGLSTNLTLRTRFTRK
ncbi:hypothetical protein HDV00_010640 [Rhizophlyctis rosea]|nr:hypothetical protein HDV00_010640 [Rhizophlyctis rosea]